MAKARRAKARPSRVVVPVLAVAVVAAGVVGWLGHPDPQPARLHPFGTTVVAGPTPSRSATPTADPAAAAALEGCRALVAAG
ncbi:hypothetical protein, partial [Microlunatus capsulatus]|uniref:hypothetical protein n=1 Tax=Microlunatus capsulatus TaxID=99117 RepID=UPI0031D1FE6D